MTWTALRWVWRLEAPLFVGMPPAGALNRCRPYVPARVLWGAVTAEISRSGNGEGFPGYGKLGGELALNCRFTYLFPAEKRGDKFLAWMPKFEKMRGHQWYCNGGKESLSDRDFRRRLLDSRPGTAIASESDSASEGTLRETECINPWWRDSNCKGETNAILLLGYVFLRNNRFRRQLDDIDTLFIGGDTRYGLGKICRVGWHEVSGGSFVFGQRVCLDGEHPEIESDIVWGHVLEGDQTQIDGIQGVKEFLGGWDWGKPWRGKIAWVPGSFLNHPVAWSIDQNGYWVDKEKKL
ncbi:hypothetical protein [Desulfatirhabdium butyrativorans]|uniref:hypothetical protein n=1 Tax=Desulfatirhabdium butyrativorans TaxID=340467 RepID=UPI00041DCC0D|nr:hypothetical protein [Desulfatirhabdium butyrativorans]